MTKIITTPQGTWDMTQEPCAKIVNPECLKVKWALGTANTIEMIENDPNGIGLVVFEKR